MSSRRQMSEQETQECLDLFYQFDRDQNGYIDISELEDVMRALWLNPTPEEMQQNMARFSEDQTGLTQDEFLDFMSCQQSPDDAENELKAAFKRFDKDGSGALDMNELGGLMKELGVEVDAEQIQEMMQEADSNNDGTIDVDEFVRVMMQK